MSHFDGMKKKYNPEDVIITLVVQDTDTEEVILEKEMNNKELEKLVKSVVDEEDWSEVYDGNCFHLTPSELKKLVKLCSTKENRANKALAYNENPEPTYPRPPMSTNPFRSKE